MIDSGTLLQGRFLIEEAIGMGGMGAVYRAVDQKFGSVVAIKETFYGDTALEEAFEREARLLNNLHHPILPHVSDYFTEKDGHFLVMEFIEGEDLSAILKRGEIFPVDVVLGWALDILDGLDYLHSQDPPVIHRDIKPNNLKLTSRGRIVLLDFGMAKETSGNTLGAKSVFGYSRRYSPLEQIEGIGTDARSDIFSLGASVFHLLTGQPPVDVLARASAIVAGRPDPLQPVNSVNPEVPEPVAAIMNSALAINSENRFESARAMSNALEYVIKTGLSPSIADSNGPLIPENGQLGSAPLGAAAGSVMPSSSMETSSFPDRGLTGKVPSLRPPVVVSDEDLGATSVPVSEVARAEPVEDFVPVTTAAGDTAHWVDSTSREPLRVRKPARWSSAVWVPIVLLSLALVLLGTYRGLFSGESESNVSVDSTPAETETATVNQSAEPLAEQTGSSEGITAEVPVTGELTAEVPVADEADTPEVRNEDSVLDLRKGPIAVRPESTRRSTAEPKPEPKVAAAREQARSTERRAQSRRSATERPAPRTVRPAFEQPSVSSIEMIMTGVPYERSRRWSVDERDVWIEEDQRRRRYRRMMRQNRRRQQQPF